MDAEQFDTLTRTLTDRRSRRGALAMALGGILATVAGGLAPGLVKPAVAKRVKNGKLRRRRQRRRNAPGSGRFDACALLRSYEPLAREPDLSGSDFSGCIAYYANLSGANLGGTNLTGANLNSTNLIEANLSGANLSRAFLSYARLSYANLSGARLGGADLYRADLSYADLDSAYLSRADLSGVYWKDTICPDGTLSNNNGGTCCAHLNGDSPIAGC